MIGFKRLGGDDNLGYFTDYEKRSSNGCIYCSREAVTREHIPPKAFLRKPYPSNLPTIPACEECNNGYSVDEEYVSYYLEILKNLIYTNSDITIIEEAINKKPKLKALLNEQIQVKENQVQFRYDENRFINIISKLARGHAGYEFDYVNFDPTLSIGYEFIFNMNEAQIDSFFEISYMDKFPEVGSRAFNRVCIFENAETGRIEQTFLEWVDVQKCKYSYMVSLDEDGDICVKIFINEILCCYVKMN